MRLAKHISSPGQRVVSPLSLVVIIALFITFLAGVPLYASDSTAVRAETLDELIDHASRNNPRIQAARAEWARMIERYPQVTALPDPMLTYTHPIEEIETRLGPTEQVFMLSQKIPFPGKLSTRGEVVTKEVEIARTRYERTVRDVIVAIKESYYELYYLDAATALARENIEVLEHLAAVGTTDYAGDATSLNDVLRAQSQYAQATYDLLLIEELRLTELTALNTLLNRDPELSLAISGEPELKPFAHTLEELYQWSEGSEEVVLARLESERNDLKLKLSKYAYYPDFKLGLNYTSIGDPGRAGLDDAGRDGVAVIFGLSIPLWFGKNRAAVTEAEFGRERSFFEKMAIENEVKNRIKRLYFRVVNSERLVKLYGETLIAQATHSMEVAETWYEEGEGSLTGLLETQSIVLNFQLAYYRAAADFLKGVAGLERLTQRRLDQ